MSGCIFRVEKAAGGDRNIADFFYAIFAYLHAVY